MDNRRHFFKSLGVLVGAASLSPTIFIPKFEPVRWKVIQRYPIPYDYEALRNYYGQWKWVYSGDPFPEGMGKTINVIAPMPEYVDCVFHVRDE